MNNHQASSFHPLSNFSSDTQQFPRKANPAFKIAKDKADLEFEKYRLIQDQIFISDFDKCIMVQCDE